MESSFIIFSHTSYGYISNYAKEIKTHKEPSYWSLGFCHCLPTLMPCVLSHEYLFVHINLVPNSK